MIKTSEAVDAYILATDVAGRLGAGYVGTEHLVYALMTGECMTARIFTAEEVTKYYELLQQTGTEAGSSAISAESTPAFTPRIALAESNAEVFAKMLGDDVIGTGHLLLGILRESECVG